MKKIILPILTLALTTFSVFAQDCAQGRYDTTIFNNIDLTSNIKYGENIDKNGNLTELKLDVRVPQNDAVADRALIIFIHGGSFVGGSKTGDDVINLANDFAKKGYVTASIDYRLGMDGIPLPGPDSSDATESVYRAMQDARAAVRFFRKDFVENGNSYGIDTSMIFLAGVSAGGFVALHLAYLDLDSEIPSYIDTTGSLSGGLAGKSGNLGYSSKVKAIVNMQGALGKTDWMENNKNVTPILSLHGTNDDVVPYNYDLLTMLGIFDIMPVYGSSPVAAKADAIGLDNCYKQFENAVHTPHCCGKPNEAAYYDTTITYMTGFLLQYTCNRTFVCSDDSVFAGVTLTTGIASTTNNSEFNLFPNPATNQVTIQLKNEDKAIVIELYNLLGTRVRSTSIRGNSATINRGNLPAGTYFVKVISANNSTTQRVIFE